MSGRPSVYLHGHAGALLSRADKTALLDLRDGTQRRLSRTTAPGGRTVNARTAQRLADAGLVSVSAALTGAQFARITDLGHLVAEALTKIVFVRAATGRVHLVAPWRGLPPGLPAMTKDEADAWALLSMSTWTRCGQHFSLATGAAERIGEFSDDDLCPRCLKTVTPDEVELVFAPDRAADGSVLSD